ncbi:MAG TPA: hypothetical protein VFQ58_11120 [Flavisolibacter sp.]|jgi:hypothetical protein|nr:hypothetical protein [Flavisolibacter sp.]
MKSIGHLGEEEKKHFILCNCGSYYDMRDLGQVLDHFHAVQPVNVEWTYSTRKGESLCYTKSGKRIGLN